MSRVAPKTWMAAPANDDAHNVVHMVSALDTFAYLVSVRSSGGVGSYHNSIVSQLRGASGLSPSAAFTTDLWHVVSNADTDQDISDTDWSASSDIDADADEFSPPTPPKRRHAALAMDAISNALRCPVCYRTMDVPCQGTCAHAVCVSCAGRIITPLYAEGSGPEQGAGAPEIEWSYLCPECRTTTKGDSAHTLLHDMKDAARILNSVCQIINEAR